MKKIHRIVLTGGPCAGKTSAIKYLSDQLSKIGIKTFVCPEAATILINSGIDPKKYRYLFQKNILKMQISNEIIIENFARHSSADHVVILYDRGIMDNKAYSDLKEWSKLVSNLHTSEVNLRDLRYDAVIHLVTAANGAFSCYTVANNKARSESPNKARQLDQFILEAWTGHPHLRVVENYNVGAFETNFQNKLKRTLKLVLSAIGVPEEIEDERKFLLTGESKSILWNITNDPKLMIRTIQIEQVYLIRQKENEERRIRKRGEKGAYIYYYTTKTYLSGSKRIEKEYKISAREYYKLFEEQDPETIIIKKARSCFIFHSQYFELDIYENPQVSFSVVEIEECPYENPIFPSTISIEKEITGNKQYSNAQIARKEK